MERNPDTRGAEERWSRAREALIERWHRITERIDDHDEGGVLALVNVMDEFCDEAMEDRAAGAPRPHSHPSLRIQGAESDYTGRCLFCMGFAELGGCFGVLEEVNRAVQTGRWEAARGLARGYIARLEQMDLKTPDAP